MDSTLSSQGAISKKIQFEDLSKEELIQKCKGLLVLAQKAKLFKTELQGELDSYKIQLETSEKEKKASQENVLTLQELVNSLTEQKLTYITDLDLAQTKVKVLNAKCTENERDLNSIKNEIVLRDKTIAEYSVKLANIDNEIVSLSRQNKRLVDENEQLINQLTEMEAKIREFNQIGLQQREQLKQLEDKIKSDEAYKNKINELKKQLEKLESIDKTTSLSNDNTQAILIYESKVKEITQLYESEKSKTEKANVKLRSYKDKILKCAACINQLKNSRYILSKTVKDYSENIPKWQNDIVNASKVLDSKLNELSKENSSLKLTIEDLKEQLKQVNTGENEETTNLKSKLVGYEKELKTLTNENNTLHNEMSEITKKEKVLCSTVEDLKVQISILHQSNEELKKVNENLSHQIETTINNENINLQIKALESEKATLVKEKLSVKAILNDTEKSNKILSQQVDTLKRDVLLVSQKLESITQEKLVLQKQFDEGKDNEIKNYANQLAELEKQYSLLKKEHDDLQDLNGLLKEEVETLKLSLEEPKDDNENMFEINESLQADIVKLETKLQAYKQENGSLLTEVKESRAKIKELNYLLSEFDEGKTKLLSYKTENAELLNEMKEINQVLKERGEAISKLNKAVAEMEKLIETLENDRDSVNAENENLQKRVSSLETDLKVANEKICLLTEEPTNKTENNAETLSEKDLIISSLKDEIEKLKQQQQASGIDAANEDNMSTSTISRAEDISRMKDLDETFEDKYTKLRIFALKLKKKLNDTIIQLQNSEQDKAKLEKMIEDKVTSNDQVDHSVGDQGDIINNTEVDKLKLKINSLTASLETSDKLAAEVQNLKDELAKLTQELSSEKESHKVTKDTLEKAKRDIKKKSVLSLEMEDYERSMKELTTKMEETKKKMVQMESTIDTQEGTITAMKTQIKLLEEQIKSEETQNRALKAELQHSVDEKKEKDSIIQIKNGIITKLEEDLEDEKRKNEESILEMTKLIGEKEKGIMALAEDKTELNMKVKRLEFKCSELSEKLGLMNIELDDLKTEYTSYKVRAQAVLRQNQTVDHSHEEQLKEEAAALRTQIEALTASLNTVQKELSSQTASAEAARRRAAEASGEAERARRRVARLAADLAALSQHLHTERADHNLQIATLTQCYKTQIAELEMKMQLETEKLKKQLTTAQENSLAANVKVLDDGNRNQYMLPLISKDEGSDGEMDLNVSMIPREEGEGSESAPSPPLSKSFLSGGARRSPVPLERLLEEGVPEDESLDSSALGLTSEQELAELKRKLAAQQQRVKHVTILLSESERECARMAQLSELLKSELRRARGDSNATHNIEYMKNVTLKFLTLPSGDERSRLVPVLQKILSLTNEETHSIQNIAKGLDPNAGKGWGSYLPWPGGSK